MKIPDIIKISAQNLRNNSTKAEIYLWNYIKNNKLWVKFLRQKPIYVFTEDTLLDRFIIADFYSFDKKLIIELDWSIHNLKEVYELDKIKEELLKNLWYKVLRIKNEDVFNDINWVLERIRKAF